MTAHQPIRTQLHKLNEVIKAGQAAQLDASRGDLLASHSGKAFLNALHDLLELDGLYDLAGDVAHELGEDREGFEIDSQGDRKFSMGRNRP